MKNIKVIHTKEMLFKKIKNGAIKQRQVQAVLDDEIVILYNKHPIDACTFCVEIPVDIVIINCLQDMLTNSIVKSIFLWANRLSDNEL